MDSLREAIKNKRKPPTPPKKAVKLDHGDQTSADATNKRGLGWPWDQPSTHFQLFLPTDQRGDAQSIGLQAECKISWIFNWELWVPPDLPQSIEWVPCVRTAAQVGDILPFLSDIRSKGRRITHLLGFNEPEIDSQANMSVPDAVRLWKEYVLPAKKELNLHLGSPGMCSNTSLCIPWLDDFFVSFSVQTPNSRDQQIDEGMTASGIEFLVLHWYGTSATEMIAFLEIMHTRYQLPVWINEFACSKTGSDGNESTESEIVDFLHNVVPWLERTPWIERYSFYGLGQGQDVGAWVGRQNNFTQTWRQQNDNLGAALSNIGRIYMEI